MFIADARRTWVAHPALAKIALDVFDEHMKGPNQYFVRREDVVNVTALDLLNNNCGGSISDAGIRANAKAALEYCGAWVGGVGCVPINWLMEDAATAEIARAQLWQWVYHGVTTDSGTKVTAELVNKIFDEEAVQVAKSLSPKSVDIAKRYMQSQMKSKALSDFLTSDLYSMLDENAAPTRPAVAKLFVVVPARSVLTHAADRIAAGRSTRRLERLSSNVVCTAQKGYRLSASYEMMPERDFSSVSPAISAINPSMH